MQASSSPRQFFNRLFLSLAVVIMTSHHVSHCIILRPNWDVYFHRRQNVPPRPSNLVLADESSASTASSGTDDWAGWAAAFGLGDGESPLSTTDVQRLLHRYTERWTRFLEDSNPQQREEVGKGLGTVRVFCTQTTGVLDVQCYYRYTSMLLQHLNHRATEDSA